MNEQVDGQMANVQRPIRDVLRDWNTYWKQQRQPWRIKQEIDTKRQEYLRTRAANWPLRPYEGIKLIRADVEWLLAEHQQSPREEDWPIYKRWQVRTGLNLQGADLSKEDLSGLSLESANLRESLLEGAILSEANLEMAVLCDAHLERAVLRETNLRGANLSGAHLEKANLESANLDRTMMALSYLQEAHLSNASLERANLAKANLERANLDGVHLEGAYLYDAHLEGASLRYAHLERTNLGGSHLEGCDFSGAFFSSATSLDNAALTNKKYGCVLFSKVRWGDADLAGIDWSQVSVLGDEQEADRPVARDGKIKSLDIRIAEYQIAVRANRQLSILLREQGLNEDAARFAYRAQKLQRIALRRQKKFGQYLFSLSLNLLSGYGYKPIRSFIAYLIVIATFAIAYFIIGHTAGPVLSPLGSVVFSMTSFHGRGFFPGGIGLDDPLTVVAAFEAFVGLLIEVTFIATLTQRLFGK